MMYGSDGLVDAVLRNFAVINLVDFAQDEISRLGRGDADNYSRGAHREETFKQLGQAVALAGFSKSDESGGSAVQVQDGDCYSQSGPDLKFVAAGALLPSLFQKLLA
jgi:hypothetical protein